MCVQVVDDKGQEHEVLLRSFTHGQETMYLLDRLASLLHSVRAQAGDMLMLTRDETGPVVTSPAPGPLDSAAHGWFANLVNTLQTAQVKEFRLGQMVIFIDSHCVPRSSHQYHGSSPLPVVVRTRSDCLYALGFQHQCSAARRCTSAVCQQPSKGKVLVMMHYPVCSHSSLSWVLNWVN